jgi:hypothetical protein
MRAASIWLGSIAAHGRTYDASAPAVPKEGHHSTSLLMRFLGHPREIARGGGPRGSDEQP